MVQEVIPGGDEELYSLGSYLAADGEALGLFCGRKLRQTPPGVGTCRVGEAVWVEEVVRAGADAAARARASTGSRRSSSSATRGTGSFKLMEVNPRLWQWHGLASACGVDLPRIAYEDLTGERPGAGLDERAPPALGDHLPPGESPAPQRPPYVDAVFARDDLKPSFVQLARLLRR